VPELLQDAATPQALADALWRQLDDEAHRAKLYQRFTDMHQTLLRDTAQESARAVLELIGRPAQRA
jgi:lipid-A-disaccharide synthase